MVYITRRERFSAAHKLSISGWSNEKNEEMFGKCSNPNWHGHNYELFVTVKGTPDPVTGFVTDLTKVGEIVREQAIKYLDHKNVNLEVPFMKGVNPTTENLAIGIWNVIESHINDLKGATLHCVKLRETENNFVEYFGEK